MTENELEKMRLEIDKIDSEIVQLFAKRFAVVKQIGVLKKANGVEIVDKNRWKKVLEKVENLAEENGISTKFIHEIYEKIHDYACELERQF